MTTKNEQEYFSYEDYTTVSKNYDSTRIPIGLDIIVEILKEGSIEPSQARVLDAGSGTGNYIAALKDRLGFITGLEFDPGMTEKARQKLGVVKNVDLHQGSILATTFEDQAFDAAMLNQVIHHLDTGEDDWPNHRQVFEELHRVVRPGGALLINTCKPEHFRDGLWYAALIPNAVDQICKRYMELTRLKQLLTDIGFEVREDKYPITEVFCGEHYFDRRGPFSKHWRDGDSTWSLVSEEELESALQKLSSLHESGEIEDFFQQREALRKATGQSVFVQAWRR